MEQEKRSLKQREARFLSDVFAAVAVVVAQVPYYQRFTVAPLSRPQRGEEGVQILHRTPCTVVPR